MIYSDKAVVLCAPTGSGKTVLFELAVVRNLIQQQSIPSSHHKAVYSKCAQTIVLSSFYRPQPKVFSLFVRFVSPQGGGGELIPWSLVPGPFPGLRSYVLSGGGGGGGKR